MKRMYQQVELDIRLFENEDIVTLSTGNSEEKFFDSDWATGYTGTNFQEVTL